MIFRSVPGSLHYSLKLSLRLDTLNKLCQMYLPAPSNTNRKLLEQRQLLRTVNSELTNYTENVVENVRSFAVVCWTGGLAVWLLAWCCVV